jgi:MOSC domain-containing protein YiiM
MLARWISETGYTGFYMRVLSEGPVATGDTLDVVERHPDRISIADVNDVIYGRSRDITLIERLAELPEFAAGGRALFAERARHLRRSAQWD